MTDTWKMHQAWNKFIGSLKYDTLRLLLMGPNFRMTGTQYMLFIRQNREQIADRNIRIKPTCIV